MSEADRRPPPGPLAGLVDELNARAPADLEPTLGYLRNTWSRLSAERRLTQSLATVPGNAGPLNSHHLAHRALTVMRDISPGYLSRFVSYVDALLWLDEANSAPAAAPVKPAKPVKRRSNPAPR
ncbi:MAG: DUF2894 domain-containing protein [Variovorax sp.]|nr:MAG: DUF2894 domain-containing protein [Variovorax sp.]